MSYRPTLSEVRSLADQGNLIPIYRELPADLETPVSVYLKLRERRSGPSFLLESVEKGEQLGRYSFIGVRSPLTVAAYGDQCIVGGAGGAELERRTANPLDLVREAVVRRKPVEVPGLPRFTGGVCGYFGYDLVRFMERLPATAERVLDVPDMVLLFTDNLVVFDHVRQRLIVIANMRTPEAAEDDMLAAYAEAVARIDGIIEEIRRPLTPPQSRPCYTGESWQSNVPQDEFERRVLEAKEFISAGDIFQVVLSQRLSRISEADPFTIYRALRMLNPSPYMFFLDFEGVAGIHGEPLRVIGSSPEMHVRLEHGLAHLHPIAGTR
ncbi:MAG: chorismate-binding protein, partial [Caldilineaceae bacterium]